MKRLYIVLAIMLMLMNTGAWAYEDFSFEGLKYRIDDSEVITNEVTCIGYESEPTGMLVIPSTVFYHGTEFKVTSIGESAFEHCRYITQVSFPENLKLIGRDAFHECKKLTTLLLPDSLTTIRMGAFSSCEGLTQVCLPKKLESIEGNVFSCCRNLTQISFPDGMTRIGHQAFWSCDALLQLSLPNSITSIEENAFGECRSLIRVSLPEKLTRIEGKTFQKCRSLKQISLPNGITSIGFKAFEDCESLTQISLPDGLISIDDEAFTNTGLKNVKFGKNIEKIGKYCFSDLSWVELGEKISYIGYRAFNTLNPTTLCVISISSKIPPVLESKNMGFESEEAHNILVLTPPHTDFVYLENSDWEDFNIVDKGKNSATVHMSGEYSLAEEIRMQTSLMPAAVTNLTVTGPLSDIDWLVIQRNLVSCYDLNLSSVTNTVIPAKAFEGNKHLLSLKLPSKLTSIGEATFQDCSNLASIAIPESVTTIGQNAFNGCSNLELTSLPNQLEKIGDNAFTNCSGIQLTELPALSELGKEAFKGCTRLFDIDLSRCNLTQIPSASFSDCKNIRSVILPETLTAINSHAFENTSLNFIELPQAVKTIGKSAFSGTSLISLNLPSGCISLAEDAFIDCDKLATVNLSPYTETLGDRCFSGCTAVRNISTPCATPPATASDTFKGISRRDCTIAIPTLKFRDYLNALDWGSFTQLANFIMLNYEEVDENGDAIAQGTENSIDAGIIEKNNYDNVTESIMLEEEQAAEDKARDDEFFGNNEETPDPEHLAAVIRKARAEARANAEENMDEKASKAFSRLYSGVSMTIGDNDGYRVNLRPSADVEIVKVELNGKDITSDLNGNYILLPKMETSGQLKVYRKIIGASIEDIPALQEESGDGQIYNMQGIPVTNPGHGIYIKDGKKVIL